MYAASWDRGCRSITSRLGEHAGREERETGDDA